MVIRYIRLDQGFVVTVNIFIPITYTKVSLFNFKSVKYSTKVINRP